MGWNTSALFVRCPEAALLAKLDGYYKDSGKQVGFDEASMRRLAPNAAIGQIGPWTALFNPEGDLTLDDDFESWRAELSKDGVAFVAMWADVSDQFKFEYYEDGECTRLLYYEGLELVDEVGDPIKAEMEADECGTSDWLFVLVEAVLKKSLEKGVRYRVLQPA